MVERGGRRGEDWLNEGEVKKEGWNKVERRKTRRKEGGGEEKARRERYE